LNVWDILHNTTPEPHRVFLIQILINNQKEVKMKKLIFLLFSMFMFCIACNTSHEPSTTPVNDSLELSAITVDIDNCVIVNYDLKEQTQMSINQSYLEYSGGTFVGDILISSNDINTLSNRSYLYDNPIKYRINRRDTRRNNLNNKNNNMLKNSKCNTYRCTYMRV